MHVWLLMQRTRRSGAPEEPSRRRRRFQRRAPAARRGTARQSSTGTAPAARRRAPAERGPAGRDAGGPSGAPPRRAVRAHPAEAALHHGDRLSAARAQRRRASAAVCVCPSVPEHTHEALRISRGCLGSSVWRLKATMLRGIHLPSGGGAREASVVCAIPGVCFINEQTLRPPEV